MRAFRALLAAGLVVLMLAACGNSKPRSIVYRDFETGLTVSVTCEHTSFTEVRDDDTCRVWILEEASP